MKTVCLLSGGMDSTTLLYWLRAHMHEVLPLSIWYGQRHACESQSAQRVCDAVGIPLKEVRIDIGHLLRGSSQTDPEVPVPEGSYAEENMKLTVVPNRNMVLLSVAAAYAIAQGAERVAYAAHAGDHAIYPDCRPEFVAAVRGALSLCDWHPVELYAPLMDKTKADIARIGADLGVPFELTWTCYKGGGKAHCGKCGSCTERREAFQLAGVPDPTEYAS